eukprot:g1837.t1
MLVAFDFITKALQTLCYAFIPKGYVPSAILTATNQSGQTTDQETWSLINGFFGLFLAASFLTTSLITKRLHVVDHILNHEFLVILHQFGVLFGLIIWTIVSWIPYLVNQYDDPVSGLPYNFWPLEVPRRSAINETTWQPIQTWGPSNHPWLQASQELTSMSSEQFAIAIIPAICLTLLFWVDQNISAMVALDDNFHLEHGTSFELDFLMLGVTILVTGLLGLPASCGLIPQNPMHTRALFYSPHNKNKNSADTDDKERNLTPLAISMQQRNDTAVTSSHTDFQGRQQEETLPPQSLIPSTLKKTQVKSEEPVHKKRGSLEQRKKGSPPCPPEQSTNLPAETFASVNSGRPRDRDVLVNVIEVQRKPKGTSSQRGLRRNLAGNNQGNLGGNLSGNHQGNHQGNHEGEEYFGCAKDGFVLEQRWSGLIHSTLTLGVLFVIPIIALIPQSVFMGGFLFMSSEAFHYGNQFLCRIIASFTAKEHLIYWKDAMFHLVPHTTIRWFTLIQFLCFCIVYMIAIGLKLIDPTGLWTSVSATFPLVLILYCIPFRTSILPLIFRQSHLSILDPLSGANMVRIQNEIPRKDEVLQPDDIFSPYMGRGSKAIPMTVSITRGNEAGSGKGFWSSAQSGMRHTEPFHFNEGRRNTLFLVAVNGASHGNVGECNAKHQGFGCLQWKTDGSGKVDRMHCIDERGGIMDWAAAPVRSDHFTLRSGDSMKVSDDPTTYAAGKFVPIFIEVLHYQYKYRGLLLHAVDSQGNTVGEWGLPSDKPGYDFWHPTTCGKQYVLHANGDDKHLGQRFYFKAPPAGTGTITFQLLLKVGPANEGEFYYPKQDLVLTEAGIESSQKYYLGAQGDNCHDTCEKYNLKCNSFGLLKAAQDGERMGLPALEKVFGREYPCALPLIMDCSIGSPAVFEVNSRSSTKYRCYYHNATCSSNSSLANGDPNFGTPTCGAYDSNARRFCACGSTQESFSSTYYDNAGTKRSNGVLWWLIMFVNTVLLLDNSCVPVVKRRIILPFVILLIMIVFAPSANAHNWVFSPSRSGARASMRCPRFSNFHNQVAKNQKVYFEASTGHRGDVVFIVVKRDQEKELRDPKIYSKAMDYIQEAPENANSAMIHRRIHKTQNRIRRLTFQKYGKRLFKRKLQSTDAMYKLSPGLGKKQSDQSTNQEVYEYSDEFLKDDKRISYVSTKYPFIEAVYKYRIHVHWPHDYMIIPFSLEGHHGAGHYVAMYKWRGYYDCVDIQLHLKKNEIEWPYGQLIQGLPKFERIDHCQFQDAEAVLSPCMDASNGTAISCVDFAQQHYRTSRTHKTSSQEWKSVSIGINVVPIKNYPGTIAGLKPHIPWENERCSLNSDIRVPLTGNITRSDVKLLTNLSYTQEARVNCHHRRRMTISTPMTLPEVALVAARKPGNDDCYVLSYVGLALSRDRLYNEKRIWHCCQRNWYETRAGSNKKYSLLKFTNIPEPREGINASSPAIAGTTYKFSFEPAGNGTKGVGWNSDNGDVYQTHSNGLSYGWNCKIPDYSFKRNLGDNGYSENSEKGWALASLEWPCPDTTTSKKWEFLLPEGNGLYEIQFYGSIQGWRCYADGEWKPECKKYMKNGFRGCVLENDRIWSHKFTSQYYHGSWRFPCKDCPVWVRNVVISDGKFTLSVQDGECSMVNYLRIKKIAETETPVFYPSMTNPWQQLEIDGGSKPIKDVVVSTPGYGAKAGSSCGSRWLFEGNWCLTKLAHASEGGGNNLQGMREVGTFKNGFIVSLADEPCDVETGACPTAKHTCAHVKSTYTCPDQGVQLCPITVDCNGVEAKYVRLQLPGTGRILNANMKVFTPTERSVPEEKDLVCYVVKTRKPTMIRAAYTIVSDPKDPAFYSTCFIRTKALSFLPAEAVEPQDSSSKYIFGEKCLRCCNAEFNRKLVSTTENPVVPRWIIENTCQDCNFQGQNLHFNDPGVYRARDRPSNPASPGTSSSASGSTSVPSSCIALHPNAYPPPNPPPPPPGNGDGTGVGDTTPDTPGGNNGNGNEGAGQNTPKTHDEKEKEKEVRAHQTTVILNSIFVPLAVIGALWFLAYHFHFKEKWLLERRRLYRKYRSQNKPASNDENILQDYVEDESRNKADVIQDNETYSEFHDVDDEV